MSADDLNVKIESTEINITVEDLPDLNIDSSPDVIVLMATPIGPQGIPGVSGLPEDIVVPNGTRILTNKFVAADSQPAFKLMADGKMWFGPGGSTPPDTNLYRHSSGRTLAADATLLLNSPDNIPTKIVFSPEGGWAYSIFTAVPGQPAGAAGAGFAFKGGAVDNRADFDIYVQNDVDGLLIYKSNVGGSVGTGDLFRFNSNGLWFSKGDGKAGPAATFDTNLFRFAADFLGTNDDFVARQGSAGQISLQFSGGLPVIYFGNAQDTDLFRFSVGVLKTSGQMQIVGNLVVTANIYSQPASNGTGFLYNPQQPGGTAFYSITQGESNPRFYFSDNGSMWWGAGGSSPIDVNLYRPTAGQLRTSALFIASGQIYSQAAGNGGGFVYNPASGGGTAFNSTVQGLANPYFYIDASGTMNWGPGSTPTDTRLYRYSGSILGTDGDIEFRAGSNYRGRLGYIGAVDAMGLQLGSTYDVYLYRKIWAPTGAPTLQTNVSFIANGTVAGGGGNYWAGVLNPNQAASPYTFFGMYYDSANNRGSIGALSGGVSWRNILVGESGSLLVNQIAFGTSNANFDTFLYRYAAGILRLDGSLFFGADVKLVRYAANLLAIGDGTTPGALLIAPASNATVTLSFYPGFNGPNPAFQINGIGTIAWGAGGATAADVSLSRGGVGQLQVGNSGFPNYLRVWGGAAGDGVIQTLVTGDSQLRLDIRADGRIWWGPGNAGVETNLYRASGQNLNTDGNFNVGYTVTVDRLNGGGRLYFGGAQDTSLYRQQAGIIKTDGIINAVGGLQINGVPVGSGGGTGPKITTSPISGGPPASPANGDIWYATGVGASSDRWAFQYNASSGSAYKWEFIGGAPLRAYIQAFQGGTTGVAWVDYGGPSVVWPRAGEMIIEFGAHFDVFQETGMVVVMADGNIVTDQLQSITPVAGSSRIASSMMTIGVIWGPATLKLMYQATGTSDWGQRWIKVTPVRV